MVNALQSTPLKLSFADMAYVAGAPISRVAPVIVGFIRQVGIRLILLNLPVVIFGVVVGRTLLPAGLRRGERCVWCGGGPADRADVGGRLDGRLVALDQPAPRSPALSVVRPADRCCRLPISCRMLCSGRGGSPCW